MKIHLINGDYNLVQIFVLLALAFSGLADSTIYQTDPYHNVPVYKKAENDYQDGYHYSEPYNVSIF